jgi:Glutathione-dependent formaldehyde-activating enzyme
MTRRAAGQLQVTIEGDPSRIALCHCLACQRRTGGVISNQARFRREQVTLGVDADSRKRQRDHVPFLSDMRLNRVLGERRLSWTNKRRHWQLRRPKLPRADTLMSF